MKNKKLIIPLAITSLLFIGIIGYSLITNLTGTHAATQNLRVQFFNGSTSPINNTLYPRFQLVNTGTTALPLSSVQLRYYFTEEGSQAQNFWCDWSTVGSSSVIGKFNSVSPATSTANQYLEIDFAGQAGNLAPNSSIQVQGRIAKMDWSNYNQANDYSFNPNASNYVDWPSVTAFVQGVQQWGTTPGGTSTQPGSTPVPSQPSPTVIPTQQVQPTPTQPVPTAVPTQAPQPSPTMVPTPQPTQPSSSGSVAYRFFPDGTSVATMQAGANALTKQQVKALIEKEIDGSWSVIQGQFGFSTKEKAYAFFLGMATRESTLNAGLETGSGSAHSYGAIQAAETAYANANPSYSPETDVPEMTQFAFTPQNFYDPGISIYMGIRHLLHFHNQAIAAGFTGVELLRHTLIGYNTGWVTTSDSNWLVQYSDEIGSLAGWYLNNGHLYDDVFTWTSDPRVDRSQPWGWL